GAGVTVLLGGTLVAAYGWESREVAGPSSTSIGEQIFGTWVWPLELLSLLLLAALVAAVAVATTGWGRWAGRWAPPCRCCGLRRSPGAGHTGAGRLGTPY